MKHIAILILTALPFLMVSLGFADDSTHVGPRVLSKEEAINMLKPQIQLRGIRINQPSPSISMEVNFEFNSATLTQQAIEQLTPIGQALQSNELSDFAFVLEGHTDAVGSEEYNLTLSEQRALSVGNFMHQHFGVDASKLQLIGQGESVLLDPGNPTSAVNRRVAITTITQ